VDPFVDVDPAAEPAWEAAWVAALDELELAVDDAEQMLADAHRTPAGAGGWCPPAGLGPLPASLETRARAILERQLAVAEALSAAAVRSRRQLRAQQALRPFVPHAPVYVDLDG
jgi:hypothetical protein